MSLKSNDAFDIIVKRITFAARSSLWDALFNAGVAELVDALDLGSSELVRVGSSPIARTNKGGFPGHLYLYGRVYARLF